MSEPTTSVTSDAHATAADLITRAQQEHATAQAGRDRVSNEDRVNGQQHGGGR